jgi:multiple sugar transport system ATP-binding protein
VVNGHRVIIDFGTQRLELPWDDAFSEALTPYHGDRVIVGIRPESLTRSTAGASGSLLHGKVSSIDYHGHEWLARLTVGFRPVELGPVVACTPDESVEPAHLAHYLRRFAIGTKSSQAVREVRGEHRAASLLLRLDSAHGWTVGDQASVTVDVAHIYVFDTNGKRIGAKAQSFAEAETSP